ncbi:hypothetical protein Z950_1328 [Sulfitobacter mediterraneus KCTC 32188]|nr:hypothetical protein Z950_1328 [Sulfitobacter mediterraneus KCTC 32188]
MPIVAHRLFLSRLRCRHKLTRRRKRQKCPQRGQAKEGFHPDLLADCLTWPAIRLQITTGSLYA